LKNKAKSGKNRAKNEKVGTLEKSKKIKTEKSGEIGKNWPKIEKN
jgi:hypothetical protein